MYCTKCGRELQEQEIYCCQCGTASERAAKHQFAGQPPRPLTRSIYDKKVAGVCAGVAKYLDVDVTVVRLVWLILTFFPPSIGLVAYIIAWIVMPKEHPQVNAAGYTVYQT